MKVLLIVNTDGALYVFRKPIIEGLLQRGHQVVSISPDGRYIPKLRELGVRALALEFDRHSVSVFNNLVLMYRIYRLVQAENPDVVHNFTHKPAIFGTLAARLAGVRGIFITVTGLGTAFVGSDFRSSVVRRLLEIQYKVVARFATRIFFQNPDDQALFRAKNLVPEEKAVLTHGSGIDLREFPLLTKAVVAEAKHRLERELRTTLGARRVVLFPARGVKEKGFFEFYEAARIINAVQPGEYLFLHLGMVDSGSSGSVTQDSITQFAKDCGVHYLGFKDDINLYMAAADVACLPSYREGTPRSLLEALAMGKVVVTTDAPGCRETVLEGWNGFLCRVGDPKSLAASLLRVNTDLICCASVRSRRLCETKYDASWLVDLSIRSYSSSLNHAVSPM